MTDTTVETTATEATTADPSTAPSDASTEQRAHGAQKRINELTRAKYDQQRRADAAEARARELEAELGKHRPKQQESTQSGRKTLADFDYDETKFYEYLDAEADKRLDERLEKKEREREQRKTQESRANSWKERVAAFEKEHSDFTERVYADGVPFSDAMAEAIAESEYGPQVAYWLADPENRDEAERISKLSPAGAARAIGRLESKFEAKSEPEPKPEGEAKGEAKPVNKLAESRATTKAPAPPPKMEPSDSASKKPWNDPTLSQEEFNKRRRAQIAARR